MTDLEEAKRLLGEVSSDIGLDAYQHVFIISNEARLKIGTVQALLENVVESRKPKGGLMDNPFGDGVGWRCLCGRGEHYGGAVAPIYCPGCGTKLRDAK